LLLLAFAVGSQPPELERGQRWSAFQLPEHFLKHLDGTLLASLLRPELFHFFRLLGLGFVVGGAFSPAG
jgi:hypothetical protein